MSDQSFDAAEFRRALGSFATGVTVITTRNADGTAHGLTVNSFNSVSLNPPLVLWSLSTSSNNLPAFQSTPNWAVHVLAADQHALSGRFARRGEDKFAGLDVEAGIGGVPLLRGCMARFQCRTAFQYEGGDHVIFIGEVLSFDRNDAAPLVFHGGRYAHATVRDAPESQFGPAASSDVFDDDSLGTRLSRSHFRFRAQLRGHLTEAGLSEEDFQLLSALARHAPLSESELDAGMAGLVDDVNSGALVSLTQRGLICPVAGVRDVHELTAAGRDIARRVLSAVEEMEAQILLRLSPGDAPALKSLLARLLKVIDPTDNMSWSEKVAGENSLTAARTRSGR